ncbi:16577_t:CDS:2, partial [Funneliformis caledonium]
CDAPYLKSQDFTALTRIGTGGSASVYAAYWDIIQTKFAIKTFDEGSTEERIMNEVFLMGFMRKRDDIIHPNIIRFIGITNLTDQKNYEIVLEFADGGTLRQYLRNNAIIRWERQLKFANDIASALLWLHKYDIIHLDLHSNNILMHQNEIKLADFGCSCEREVPIPKTNDIFVKLYKIILELNSINDPKRQFNNYKDSKENEKSDDSKNDDFINYDDLDIVKFLVNDF